METAGMKGVPTLRWEEINSCSHPHNFIAVSFNNTYPSRSLPLIFSN
jgi:hypothetical protein